MSSTLSRPVSCQAHSPGQCHVKLLLRASVMSNTLSRPVSFQAHSPGQCHVKLTLRASVMPSTLSRPVSCQAHSPGQCHVKQTLLTSVMSTSLSLPVSCQSKSSASSQCRVNHTLVAALILRQQILFFALYTTSGEQCSSGTYRILSAPRAGQIEKLNILSGWGKLWRIQIKKLVFHWFNDTDYQLKTLKPAVRLYHVLKSVQKPRDMSWPPWSAIVPHPRCRG